MYDHLPYIMVGMPCSLSWEKEGLRIASPLLWSNPSYDLHVQTLQGIHIYPKAVLKRDVTMIILRLNRGAKKFQLHPTYEDSLVTRTRLLFCKTYQREVWRGFYRGLFPTLAKVSTWTFGNSSSSWTYVLLLGDTICVYLICSLWT